MTTGYSVNTASPTRNGETITSTALHGDAARAAPPGPAPGAARAPVRGGRRGGRGHSTASWLSLSILLAVPSSSLSRSLVVTGLELLACGAPDGGVLAADRGELLVVRALVGEDLDERPPVLVVLLVPGLQRVEGAGDVVDGVGQSGQERGVGGQLLQREERLLLVLGAGRQVGHGADGAARAVGVLHLVQHRAPGRRRSPGRSWRPRSHRRATRRRPPSRRPR